MATTADIRMGMIIKLDGSLYSVVEFGQNKTARAAAKVWAKLKGVDNTRSIEHTWNSGDNIFPVRVERRPYQFLYKDESGFTAKETEWHRVTCFNGLGRVVGQHATKGMLVSVRGRIHNSKWTDREGVDRYSYEIIADDVQFLSRSKQPTESDDVGNDDEIPSD